MTNGRRPKTPGAVHSIVTLALIVGLATFALTARQPPPPTIAEFAPQAVEQITDAPTDQASKSGVGGAGDCSPGQVCEGGAGAGDAGLDQVTERINVPRVRRCVGQPPRQIEDPQSPPCVPFR